jgi:hypothetical protein
MGEWGYSPILLTSALDGSEWVSFTLQQLNPLRKISRYPLYRMPGGLQSRPGRYGEEKNIALRGIKSEPFSP